MAKTAIQAVIDGLGTGLGYLYILDHDNSTQLEVFENNADGRDTVRVDAVINAAFGANKRAFGKIKINSFTGTGDITTITIGGSNQINANITVTGRTPTQIAGDIVTGMNAFDPGTAVNYTATYVDDTVTVYAPASIGSTANAHTISLAVNGGALSTTNTNPAGGFTNSEPTSGHYYWIDANYDAETNSGAATATTTKGANAVDITDVLVPTNLNAANDLQVITIADGLADFTRRANITILALTGEGSSADILTDLSTAGMSGGDLVFIIQSAAGNTITITDTGNISIDQSIDFDVDSVNKSMVLVYNNATNSYNEKLRSSALAVTVASMRTASIPQPVSGTETLALATGGGTENRTPGTDKGYVVVTGTGTLSSSWTIQGDGTPIDGETWRIDYRATFTASGNNFTIFGVALTDVQMLNGACTVIATWDSTAGAYRSLLIVDLGTAGSIENAMIPTNEITSTKLELQAAVIAATYTNATVTVDAQGVIVAISSGSSTAVTGPFVENMALVYGAANDLRVTSADGSIFSSTNVGKVRILSTAGPRELITIDVNTDDHFFIDDTGASDIVGEEFGLTSGTAWANPRPFFLYACNLNDTAAELKFAISPNPCAVSVPLAANIGYHANPAATPSDLNFFFLSSADPATLASKPCALIGRIRMTMSAGDDWTVANDALGFEIGITEQPFYGYWYTMPLAQMGAAAGTYFKAHGGTAPVFTNNFYRYQVGADGYVDCEIYVDGDGGADGLGAVTVQIALPYLYRNTDFNASIGAGFNIDTTPITVNVVAQAISNSTSCELLNDTVALNNVTYVNGARTVQLKLRYQAFIV